MGNTDPLTPRRRNYTRSELHEAELAADPIEQLQQWVDDASKTPNIDEPTAMVLATVGVDGRPSARIVLARQIDANGITFFTNYTSRKGTEIEHHPAVAATFYWGPLERQIRIEGVAERVSSEESDRYFAARPYLSRLSAHASQQSSVIADRNTLETEIVELVSRFPEGESVPRPEQWGGYRISPDLFEFWQGRPNRLHDRLRYRTTPVGWIIERLAP